MPPESRPKLSLTWADVLLVTLILLLCMGAWIGGERLVAPSFASKPPSKETLEARHQVPARRAELAAAERNLAVREERLREQRLEDMRQRAVTTAYEALYPQLRAAGAAAAPADVRSGYLNARMVASATQGFLQALENDLARQGTLVSQARAALRQAEQSAAGDLQKAQREHIAQRRLVNAVCGAALALAALAILWMAAGWLARRLEITVHAGLAFGVGAALLFVLVAYHVFQRAGAVAAGSLLALGWLAYVVWKHRPAAQAAEERA